MYQYFSVAILILALSCTNSQPKKQIEIAGPKEEIKTEFHPILRLRKCSRRYFNL